MLSVISSVDDIDWTDKFTLLAFYSSSNKQCKNHLEKKLIYPWPFAGYSSPDPNIAGMWWDETMTVARSDLDNDVDGKISEMIRFFQLEKDSDPSKPTKLIECPSFVFIPRGIDNNLKTLDNVHIHRNHATMEKFHSWIWSLLQMKVNIVNKSPWTVSQWWLDGYRGIRRNDIEPEEKVSVKTYVSHSFFFRASWVQGNTLTNESALLWYTSKIQDDNAVIEIKSRCFDHSGECVRWAREGKQAQ